MKNSFQKTMLLAFVSTAYISSISAADNLAIHADTDISISAKIEDMITVEHSGDPVVLESDIVGDIVETTRITVRRSGAGSGNNQKLFDLKITGDAGGNGENFHLRDGDNRISMNIDYRNWNRNNAAGRPYKEGSFRHNQAASGLATVLPIGGKPGGNTQRQNNVELKFTIPEKVLTSATAGSYSTTLNLLVTAI